MVLLRGAERGAGGSDLVNVNAGCRTLKPLSIAVRVLLFSHHDRLPAAAFNDAADAARRSNWCSRPIAVISSTIRGRTARFRCGSTMTRRRSRRSSTRARRRPIDGVIAVGDRPVVTGRARRRSAGLPWQPVDGARRPAGQAPVRARPGRPPGLPVAALRIVHALASIDASRVGGDGAAIPCVLKPVGLSGSRGVIRAELASGARRRVRAHPRAAARARRSAPRATGLEDEILVEGYIDGDEFAVEGRADRRRARASSRSSTSPIRSTGRSSKRRST